MGEIIFAGGGLPSIAVINLDSRETACAHTHANRAFDVSSESLLIPPTFAHLQSHISLLSICSLSPFERLAYDIARCLVALKAGKVQKSKQRH